MRILALFVALISISPPPASADVSLRNGNYFVYFRDISYPGGMEPKIERVYNSKSDFIGMFGYSWGTQYETRLKVESDGSIIATEFGGGPDNRFTPKNYKQSDITTSINLITDAAKKSGVVSSAAQVQNYKARLSRDADFRSTQNQIFISKGILPARKIAEGTQFTSTKFFYQYITRVKGGYVRVMEGGNIQKFNEAGRLVQIQDRNKNFINFTYNGNGKMVELVDNQNRKMLLSYNTLGYVEKIVGESGKSASYKYSKNGYLEYSKDDQGIENGYKYTNDVFRNLSELSFLSEKRHPKLTINYYGVEKNVNVKSIVNKDGTLNEYEYTKDPKNPSYYAVKVSLKNPSGAKMSEAKYEYFSKVRPDGEIFTSKMITTMDGDKKEEYYDEKLGFPVKIVSNGRVTTMAYDQKGRMTRKVTPIETTELAYHPSVGKVSKVTRKLRSGTILWSMFDYDTATGNLTLARNSDKKQVKLIYDQAGRIRALVDQSGKQLTFKYNELSKPIEIADAKLGTIKISYKNSGEVDKMESNGGASAASDVLRALQNLIDITAPAGVTMSI